MLLVLLIFCLSLGNYNFSNLLEKRLGLLFKIEKASIEPNWWSETYALSVSIPFILESEKFLFIPWFIEFPV
jgi:hypothetical protein